MKISNILIVLTFVFAIACSGKKSDGEHVHSHDKTAEDHGHSHHEGEHGHSHAHDEHHKQEEFTISGDSVKAVPDSTHHTNEDASTHHNH